MIPSREQHPSACSSSLLPPCSLCVKSWQGLLPEKQGPSTSRGRREWSYLASEETSILDFSVTLTRGASFYLTHSASFPSPRHQLQLREPLVEVHSTGLQQQSTPVYCAPLNALQERTPDPKSQSKLLCSGNVLSPRGRKGRRPG